MKQRSILRHSNKKRTEESEKIVIGAALQIWDYTCNSNFVVANFRYDIFLGSPWHYEVEPTTNQNEETIRVRCHAVSGCPLGSSLVQISNISIQKFRSILQTNEKTLSDKDTDTAIFRLTNVSTEVVDTLHYAPRSKDPEVISLKQ